MKMTLVRALLAKAGEYLFDVINGHINSLLKNFKSKTNTSVNISCLDALYAPLLLWLKENNIEANCRNYRYRTVYTDSKFKPIFGPAIGVYNIFYKGKRIKVQVKEDQIPMVGDNGGSDKQTIESITLTVYGDGAELKTLLNTLFREYITKPKKTIDVRNYDGRYWVKSKDLPKKHNDGLILAEGKLEYISKKVLTWKNAKDWYVGRDIPYRLGLLLYGKPGTGKTSLVKYLARVTDFNIYVCMATALSQDNFTKSLAEVPRHSIILIEDIDCLYEQRNKKGKDLVDFSSLLNGLDGLVAVEDVIVIMTTNHPDVLDAALIRPGRIDEKIEIGLCTPEQGQRLFHKFFPESNMELNLPDDTYTPAQLQEVFLRSEKDVDVLVNLANIDPVDFSNPRREVVESTICIEPEGALLLNEPSKTHTEPSLDSMKRGWLDWLK